MTDWQDISTAPKDGTEVLALVREFTIPIVIYFISREYLQGEYGNPDHMEEGWYPSAAYPDGWEYVVEPTHWMPLPPPPALERVR